MYIVFCNNLYLYYYLYTSCISTYFSKANMSVNSDMVATIKSRRIICAGHMWTRTGSRTSHKMDTGEQKTAI